MLILYMITGLILGFSLLASPGKTKSALKIALRRFLKIAPEFIGMLMLLSIALYMIPEQLLVQVLTGDNKWSATIGAIGLGSVTIMPGFVAFPLCGILLQIGALYMVLSAFSTTLMMVGVATFPLEKRYLGTQLTLWRNAVSFIIAIVVAIATGLFFGELP